MHSAVQTLHLLEKLRKSMKNFNRDSGFHAQYSSTMFPELQEG